MNLEFNSQFSLEVLILNLCLCLFMSKYYSITLRIPGTYHATWEWLWGTLLLACIWLTSAHTYGYTYSVYSSWKLNGLMEIYTPKPPFNPPLYQIGIFFHNTTFVPPLLHSENTRYYLKNIPTLVYFSRGGRYGPHVHNVRFHLLDWQKWHPQHKIHCHH